jgi:hypothetical protein
MHPVPERKYTDNVDYAKPHTLCIFRKNRSALMIFLMEYGHGISAANDREIQANARKKVSSLDPGPCVGIVIDNAKVLKPAGGERAKMTGWNGIDGWYCLFWPYVWRRFCFEVPSILNVSFKSS